MNSGKVVLGLLAGIAAGAVLGILLAPDSGSNTRKKISKKGDDYMGDLKEKFNDFVENMTERFETVKDEAEDMLDKTKAKAQEVKREVRNGMNEKSAQQS